MKVVINTSFGSVTEKTASERFNPGFAEEVRSGRFVGRIHEGPFGGYAETLKVVEIPDEATDVRIVNYDGCEGVLYVIDGKIHYEGSRECGEIFNTEY